MENIQIDFPYQMFTLQSQSNGKGRLVAFQISKSALEEIRKINFQIKILDITRKS